MILRILSVSLLSALWISTAFSISLPLNTTAAAITTTFPTSNDIVCYKQGDHHVPITVADCRFLLNNLKGIPNYRRVQPFMEGHMPRLPTKDPSTPPYVWHDPETSCTVEIIANNPQLIDMFSFEQARSLATEIIQDCQDTGGFGGESVIGVEKVGWMVRAMGIELDPGVSNDTTVVEEAGQGNGTPMAEPFVNVDTSRE